MGTDTTSAPQTGTGDHQTTVRQNTAVPSPSSAKGNAYPPLSQEVMKTQMQKEIQGATFTVDLTAEGAPFYVHPDTVESVLGLLGAHHNLTSTTLFNNEASTEDRPRFPPGGFDTETSSYEPLTSFLNLIIRATNSYRPSVTRYLKGLHFLPHGREVKGKYNSQGYLKPDILGLLHGPASLQTSSWESDEIAVIGEVKPAPGLSMLTQLGTYARCYLAADRRRSFALAIGFGHKTLEIIFFVFHRSGISSSGAIRLNKPGGFETAVRWMVGILSIPDEEAFGMDMTRRGRVYRIQGRDYSIERPIYVRNSVRGRATFVCSLKAAKKQDKSADLRSRNLTLTNGDKLPDDIVYKFSYQTEGGTSEGLLFSKFFGQFGVIDVIGFHTSGPEERFGSTSYLIQGGVFWDFSKSQGENDHRPVPKKRHLQCTVMSFECLPLLDLSDKEIGIPTPAEMVETILHAMIGHYNLFLGGVLHRDVSQGNILRLREPIKRSECNSADELRSVIESDLSETKCRGFLIDGDHSINWRNPPPASMLERSGTLPFMSERLLFACVHQQPIVHTAIDDLESFLWVLVWSIAHILKKVHTSSRSRSIAGQLAEWLSNYHLPDIMMRDSTVRRHWMDVVFKELVKEWLSISDAAALVVEMHVEKISESGNNKHAFDQLEDYCKTVYTDFIRVGYKHLESIRQYPDWEAVVNARV